jgi:hypothetical protein
MIQPFGKRAAKLSAGDQPSHVHLDDEALSNRTRGRLQTLRSSFDDSGLANARLANQARIVRSPLSEDIDHLFDLSPATDNRIELSLVCEQRQIAAEGSQERERFGVQGCFTSPIRGGGQRLRMFLGQEGSRSSGG